MKNKWCFCEALAYPRGSCFFKEKKSIFFFKKKKNGVFDVIGFSSWRKC